MNIVKYLVEHGHSLEYAINLNWHEKAMIQGLLLADMEMNPLKYSGI